MKTGKDLKKQMLQYVGDYSQLFGIKEYALIGGRANGVKAMDVKTGGGLEFTVVADRSLDISGLSFRGTNCSYLNKTGMVAPGYYEKEGDGFLRNFFGGFLTTCGLRNVGSPCEDEGEKFPTHGRISNISAEEISVSTEWKDGIPELKITGKIREARMFGENLVLTRKITCRYNENRIYIQNTVENLGFKNEGLMILFHFNLGYPLLDEDAILVTPTSELVPRDAEARKGETMYNQFQPPTENYAEQVFYHQLNTGENGETSVALINQKLGIAAALHFSKTQLRNFIQWKQMGEGEYVLGMEPANCLVAGRAEERKNGTLEYIGPGETRNFDLVVEIVSGEAGIEDMIRKIKELNKYS
jgi:hypothetical protein